MTHDLDRGGMPRAMLALLVMGGMLALAIVPGPINAQEKPKADAKDQKKPDAKPQAKAEKKAEAKPQPKTEKKAEVKPAPAPAPAPPQPNSQRSGQAQGTDRGPAEGSRHAQAQGRDAGAREARRHGHRRQGEGRQGNGDGQHPQEVVGRQGRTAALEERAQPPGRLHRQRPGQRRGRRPRSRTCPA